MLDVMIVKAAVRYDEWMSEKDAADKESDSHSHVEDEEALHNISNNVMK